MGQLKRRDVLTAALGVPLLALGARAGSYPARPIKVIIPYTPGNVGEAIMRLLATSMEKTLGQRLVIESKGGANLGTIEVARSPADGYTVLVAATNNYLVNQYLAPTAFDPLTALEMVAKVADVPLVFFSNPSVPARTFPEFVSYARANPGKLGYATMGAGTIHNLLIEKLKRELGMDILHVPFRGSPQAMLSLIANDVQLILIGWSAAAGALQDGKVTALAVSTGQRLPMKPELPTMIEEGIRDFNAANWWGLSVPAGTPKEVVETLRRAVSISLTDAAVRERFNTMGWLSPRVSPSGLVADVNQEAISWRALLKASGLLNK